MAIIPRQGRIFVRRPNVPVPVSPRHDSGIKSTIKPDVSPKLPGGPRAGGDDDVPTMKLQVPIDFGDIVRDILRMCGADTQQQIQAYEKIEASVLEVEFDDVAEPRFNRRREA